MKALEAVFAAIDFTFLMENHLFTAKKKKSAPVRKICPECGLNVYNSGHTFCSGAVQLYPHATRM